MLCGNSCVVKHSETESPVIATLPCRAWNCPECAPKRAKKLLAQAIAGRPTTFITLTVNPREGEDALDRRRKLAVAWNHLVKRIKRRWKVKSVPFIAVVEATKRGEPHLHILARLPFIPQKWLSAQMKELINAPIVDIRTARGKSQVIAYCIKYVTKKPTQFGKSKRYWMSQNWLPTRKPADIPVMPDRGQWQVKHVDLLQEVYSWVSQGWKALRESEGVYIMKYIGWGRGSLDESSPAERRA
jgi:DNA-binding HxlR family transcriptional regulator